VIIEHERLGSKREVPARRVADNGERIRVRVLTHHEGHHRVPKSCRFQISARRKYQSLSRREEDD
jgi:hypothetical protein